MPSSEVKLYWQKERKNDICQCLGLDLVNINVYAFFPKKIVFHKVQYIALFQNSELGKAATNDKCHLVKHWARTCQRQYECQILSKYSAWLKK